LIFISIIIPVRNEAAHIGEVLDRLLEQDYDSNRFEVLVVDGLSTDETPDIVKRYTEQHPNVRYFENPKQLSSAARNIGVHQAQGDAVLVVDGHCIIDRRDMLQNVDAAFAKSGADCLGRPQPQEMKDATPLQWAIAVARRSPLGHHADSFIYSEQPQFVPASSVAIAYRKSVFKTVFNEQGGYFDESFDACEDVEFNTRCDKAGLKCYFEPAIAVRYVPRKTITGLAYQLFRYGRGRVKLCRKHRETFSLKSFGPGLFVFGVIAGFILWLVLALYAETVCCSLEHPLTPSTYGWYVIPLMLSQWVGLIYAAVLCLYGVAILLESTRIAVKHKLYWKIGKYLPGIFLAIHFGFGFGILLETVRPKSQKF
jgi:glycosyltransferase involved in cell wall biosynthesis